MDCAQHCCWFVQDDSPVFPDWPKARNSWHQVHLKPLDDSKQQGLSSLPVPSWGHPFSQASQALSDFLQIRLRILGGPDANSPLLLRKSALDACSPWHRLQGRTAEQGQWGVPSADFGFFSCRGGTWVTLLHKSQKGRAQLPAKR